MRPSILSYHYICIFTHSSFKFVWFLDFLHRFLNFILTDSVSFILIFQWAILIQWGVNTFFFNYVDVNYRTVLASIAYYGWHLLLARFVFEFFTWWLRAVGYWIWILFSFLFFIFNHFYFLSLEWWNLI